MPADITGSDVLEENPADGSRHTRFLPGPLFTEILLADEINRSPPKTQSALLEAMQEGHVTVGGRRHLLPTPFLTLATQNPIEQEGTYPLPEGQRDRFQLMIEVGYPTRAEELDVVARTTSAGLPTIAPVSSREALINAMQIVRAVPMAEHVLAACVDLARLTRPTDSHARPGCRRSCGGVVVRGPARRWRWLPRPPPRSMVAQRPNSPTSAGLLPPCCDIALC